MENIKKLWEIVKKLRGPQGCPWDREQDQHTLLTYLIEEVYEIANALEKNDIDELKEELGDLLFIVFSYISIGEEKNLFSLEEVIEKITKKMTARHPHVFGNRKLKTTNDVLDHWHKLKAQEHKEKALSILDNVPENLPALTRAKLLQERASRVGFDWKNPEEAFSKVKEEISELEEHLKETGIKKNKIREEIGDLLFSVVNASRLLKIEPEIALKESIQKFVERFKYIEDKLRKQDKSPEQSSLEEMESLWQESKDI